MKFGLYEVKSHGHWKIEEFILGVLLLNGSLTKMQRSLCRWSFFGMLK
jgi:hypothetical protein